jgi:tetratricopeptide (TPR) repeat protein
MRTMFVRTTRLLLVVSALTLSACPKKTKGPATVAELAESEANDPAKNFAKGLEALQQKGGANYDQAYGFFAKAESLSGKKTASFNAGWCAEQLGKPDVAEGHYRKALAADAAYAPAFDSLARVLKQLDKNDELVALYAKHLEGRGDDLVAMADYMDALVEAGKDAEAVAEGQAILRKNPNSDAVYRSLSGLYLRQGNLEMARLMGDKALALNDKDPNIFNNLGVVLLRNGDEPGAIAKFQTARQLDTNHYEANVNLGLLAVDAGDYALALECFDAALVHTPKSFEARLGRAVALRGMGQYADAGKIYDQLIAENPKQKIAYWNAATLNEKYVKDFTKAEKYLVAYKDSHVGQIGPDDAVFKRIEAVKAAKAAEEERKRVEAERKKAEEERQKRAAEALAAMDKQVGDFRAKIEANKACLDPMVVEEVSTVLDTVAEAIAAKDTSSAQDMKSLLDDYYTSMLDEAIAATCATAAPAPAEEAAPAEGTAAPTEGTAAPTEPAPAEGGTTAPTEGTPAPQ